MESDEYLISLTENSFQCYYSLENLTVSNCMKNNIHFEDYIICHQTTKYVSQSYVLCVLIKILKQHLLTIYENIWR